MDLQYLVDKFAGKLVVWEGQNITFIGRTALVKFVLTSQDIYFIMLFIVPSVILQDISKIGRAFIGSASEKTTGAKCKII